MDKKLAMVSGATGQDGSNLVELLLSKGYKVIGLIRRNSCPNSERYAMLCNLEDNTEDFNLEYFDLADAANINHLIQKYKPDYFFNTAAMSHVAISFNTPESTLNYNLLGVLRILEAIKNFSPTTRFLQCSSSEQFGITPPPQNEDTKMMPQSPYGIAKLGAFHLVRLYRNAYGLFACNSICFNHEGPRRTINFVTRKVTRGVARIVAGTHNKLVLGNLESKRDWGDSRDYVRAMELIINHSVPDDFVVSTGETHSIREFVKDAFAEVGLDYLNYVEESDKYKRPAEVPALLGDSTKLRTTLGWIETFKYSDIIKDMLNHDLQETAGLTLEQAKEKMK